MARLAPISEGGSRAAPTRALPRIVNCIQDVSAKRNQIRASADEGTSGRGQIETSGHLRVFNSKQQSCPIHACCVEVQNAHFFAWMGISLRHSGHFLVVGSADGS
jgi:hypothetical protein